MLNINKLRIDKILCHTFCHHLPITQIAVRTSTDNLYINYI